MQRPHRDALQVQLGHARVAHVLDRPALHLAHTRRDGAAPGLAEAKLGEGAVGRQRQRLAVLPGLGPDPPQGLQAGRNGCKDRYGKRDGPYTSILHRAESGSGQEVYRTVYSAEKTP